MQFKHPEILWALLFLLIPIFIHLFQLRRFKKTPFTNVAMLQKVVSESRKSSQLKKWLLLLSRLALLAALVIAFAQPFSSGEKALKPLEMVIYLDNSFSMQAKSEGIPLLKKAVQDLFQSINPDAVFSLFTNDRVFKDVTIKNVQNDLLSLAYTSKQYALDEVFLKAETLFSEKDVNTKKLVLISDFQNVAKDSISNGTIESHYVQLRSDIEQNIALDSVFLNTAPAGQNELTVLLSGGQHQSVPVSMYDGAQLIAKSSANFEETRSAKVVFSLPSKTEMDGKLTISEQGLPYDNNFFFNINTPQIIKVLAISEASATYLERLFPKDEFELVNTSLSQLNYSLIDQQHLVVIDNLKSISESLRRTLISFYGNGGSIVVIPSLESDIQSYNTFLQSFGQVKMNELINIGQEISQITFEHPLYQNVFEKRTDNFQHPKVSSYFATTSNAAKVLSYKGGEPFLLGGNGFYMFSAPLTKENSNFKSSPLIVPTFYNMAQLSLKNPDLYFVLGEDSQTDVTTSLGKDNILSLSKNNVETIPRQQLFNNKVSLFFRENPQEDGIFSVVNKDSIYKKVSFNYSRNESDLQYADMEKVAGINGENSITELIDYIKSESNVTTYWKWFVILALLFALVEVLIQKLIA